MGRHGPDARREFTDIALARPLQFDAAMTRFDRIWEPLFVLVVFAIVWLGTLR